MYASRFGTADAVSPEILEGSLWAEGIGFPTGGWIRKSETSNEENIIAILVDH